VNEPVRVFDASALIALFRGNVHAYRLLEAADAGSEQVVFPTAAIAEANSYLQASEGGWAPILMGRVGCLPLSEHVAITIGPWPGDLASRHVVFETRAMWGDVVTVEPDRYKPYTVPLVVI
jgi:hypothetical protein